MRKFSSYGAVDKDLNFYVPREELIQKAYTQLIGESPEKKGGHYITVWAPPSMRQDMDHAGGTLEPDVR